jgi:hypothetical protein
MLLPATINAFTFNSFNIPSPIIEKLFHETSTIKKPFDSGTLLNVKLIACRQGLLSWTPKTPQSHSDL